MRCVVVRSGGGWRNTGGRPAGLPSSTVSLLLRAARLLPRDGGLALGVSLLIGRLISGGATRHIGHVLSLRPGPVLRQVTL